MGTATETYILPELQITWRHSHTWPTIACYTTTVSGIYSLTVSVPRLEWFNFFPAHKDMRMFSVYVEGGYGLEKINVPNSWSQLQEYANQVKWTLYVFRKERLVKIIRPYNLKS